LLYPEDDLENESDDILEHVANLEEVNNDLVANLLKRVVLLEDINGQLLTDLKSCIVLLNEFKTAVPNSDQWQDLLDILESDLEAAETAQEHKMFNQTCGIIGTP
jgi:hypothetical protein